METISSRDIREVFAVPGESSFIDAIHPETGLSVYAGENLEQVQLRYPGAVRMGFDAWMASKVEQQNPPLVWDTVTEEEYYRLFECLPPEAYASGYFLVGEPDDHCAKTGKPRFRAYGKRGEEYVKASRPMTVAEFRQVYL